MRFEGKSAIVTGASEGIGFAIAAGLVEGGARVVLVARREDKLAAAVAKLGEGASYVVGDVAEAATADRAVEAAVSRHGGLDLLVNNAGILLPGVIGKQPIEHIDTILGVNLRGTILFTRAAVGAMSGRKGASILLVSSATGGFPTPGLSVYGATKAALFYMAKVWAMELAPQGIRVNCLSPGGTETPALEAAAKMIPGLREGSIASNLIKRHATSEEIAGPALFLLDEHTAGYVTGSSWDITGGYHLG